MRKLDSNAHSVFLLYYHLILVIKYRKKILTDPVSERAREIFEYIAPKYRNSANLSMRIKAQAAD